MENKLIPIFLTFIMLFSIGAIIPLAAQNEVVVISNNIDVVSKPLLEEYFRGYSIFPQFLGPEDFESLKGSKLIVILGGPDSPYGTGDIVKRYLDNLEMDFIRQEDQKYTFIKPDPYGHADTIAIIAGVDRERTYEETVRVINGASPNFTSAVSTAAEGRVAIKDLPLILSGISYDTETVNREAHIHLSLQNYGKGRATNVIVEISDDYYSNFNFVSTDQGIKVEGNKFYVGNIDGGKSFKLDINLRAKEVGVYSGAITYTYDELGTSAKIRDITTRVPL